MRSRLPHGPLSRSALSCSPSIALVRRASLGVLALAALSAAFGGASAQAGTDKLAKHLRELDPAALVGGQSIVGTKPGRQLHGVHGKPNFIVALGDGETIHGASKDDQLGAIGDGAKIVPSKQGHSLIVAGPHSKVVVTGKGHNLIYSHAKGATITLASPGNEVIANGPHDRIVCAAHAHNELIEVAKGEKVSKSCKGHHNNVEPLTKSSLSAHSSSMTAHASATVSGSGTNSDPFIAPCDDPSQVDCTVSGFDSRLVPCPGINCFWGTENVPDYRCPGRVFTDTLGERHVFDHPYLLNRNYAPAGTHLDNGVAVEGLGPVGAEISTINNPDPHQGTGSFSVETSSELSTVTNWTPEFRHYKVILHCTSDPTHGY